MFDENYSKPFHYAGSPSPFLDLDTFVYIMIIALEIWLVLRRVQRKKGKTQILYSEFMSRYMLPSSAILFIIYLISLLLNGKMVLSNWIVCFLPLLYSTIIQFIFYMYRKIKKQEKVRKYVKKKYVIPIVITVVGIIWYHLPIHLSYQYAALDSSGNTVKVDISGEVYKNIFLADKKYMVITIESSKIKEIPFEVTTDQFVAESRDVKSSDYDNLFYTQEGTVEGITYRLRISSNHSVIEYEEFDGTGYFYSLQKTGRWVE